MRRRRAEAPGCGRAAGLLWLLVAVGLAGCSSSSGENFAPRPAPDAGAPAADGESPGGAAMGARCTCDAECTPVAGFQSYCVEGICMVLPRAGCEAGDACPAGLDCFDLERGGGLCFPNCSHFSCAGACDSDNSCVPDRGDVCRASCARYCSNPCDPPCGEGLWCESGRCVGMCGESAPALPCEEGFCPSNSTCANAQCTCEAGAVPLDCAGVPCSQSDCSREFVCGSSSCTCDGRECGSDSCGQGACGTCPSGQECSAQGRCQCVASCQGKSCGDDGCGGSCGTCPDGQSCGAQGQCQCVPGCQDKQCGDDGCGGSCGGCPAGEVCGGEGHCGLPGCGPDYPKITCPNGSTCPVGSRCVSGGCECDIPKEARTCGGQSCFDVPCDGSNSMCVPIEASYSPACAALYLGDPCEVGPPWEYCGGDSCKGTGGGRPGTTIPGVCLNGRCERAVSPSQCEYLTSCVKVFRTRWGSSYDCWGYFDLTLHNVCSRTVTVTGCLRKTSGSWDCRVHSLSPNTIMWWWTCDASGYWVYMGTSPADPPACRSISNL